MDLVTRLRPYAEGLSTYLPARRTARSGGTPDQLARYCYSVWLRHLVGGAARCAVGVPASVLEVGPGASLGVGLAAALSGARRYFACDVSRAVLFDRDAVVLDSLVDLFGRRAPIPGDDEFPRVNPKFPSYEFPHTLLTGDLLSGALDQGRIGHLRDELGRGAPRDPAATVQYAAPATPLDLSAIVAPESVDWVMSQAVMEYVSNLPAAYGAMHDVLSVGGVMTHEIDFGAHQTSADWDGHWRRSELQWRVIRGRRRHFLNRQPLSAHLRALEGAGLDVVEVEKVQGSPTFNAPATGPLRSFSGEDLITRSAFIVARKSKSVRGRTQSV